MTDPERRARAGVVVVGSELLHEGRQDTNGPWIAEALAAEGFEPTVRVTVGDDRAGIASAIRHAMSGADLVVACGGLGPTFDDLTREGAADALGLTLSRDPALAEHLRERYRLRGVAMPEAVIRMADRISTAEILANSVGSAPGQLLKGPPALALVPGVPSEMVAMLRDEVIPRVRGLARGAASARRAFRITGLYESQVEEKLGPAMKGWTGIAATILAAPGDVSFILRSAAGDRRSLEEAAASVRAALGAAIYTEADEPLEAVAGALLRGRSLTLSTAESCTGGMLGGMITAVAGASDYYAGGVVAYRDEIKSGWLGVDPAILREHGAVSSETALAMARGVRERTGSDVSLAVTGIAGPGGGSPAKPVGRVHLAMAGPWGESAAELTLPGNRAIVRLLSCRAALNKLRLKLMRAP